jgi:hypothetical protein
VVVVRVTVYPAMAVVKAHLPHPPDRHAQQLEMNANMTTRAVAKSVAFVSITSWNPVVKRSQIDLPDLVRFCGRKYDISDRQLLGYVVNLICIFFQDDGVSVLGWQKPDSTSQFIRVYYISSYENV